MEQTPSYYTLILIAITALVSYFAFNNTKLKTELMLWPVRMKEPKEYYRLITSGFIHLDMQHLVFNMITLFFFGRSVELIFTIMGKHNMFLLLYLSGILVSGLPGYYKNRNNPYYAALGASGGVAAVIFASIYYQPWASINFIIPSILFAILYIAYSYHMSRKGSDNIGHDAHMWGAIYGFVFAFLIDPSHGQYFIEQMKHPVFLNHRF